jgi:hypothetical protein
MFGINGMLVLLMGVLPFDGIIIPEFCVLLPSG